MTTPIGGYQTPPFKPSSCQPPSTSDPSQGKGKGKEGEGTDEWKWVLSSPCQFPLSIFLSTMKGLAEHPERNSSFILRADPLPLTDSNNDYAIAEIDEISEMEMIDEIRVKLLPRHPRRDGTLNQTCRFFRSTTTTTIGNELGGSGVEHSTNHQTGKGADDNHRSSSREGQINGIVEKILDIGIDDHSRSEEGSSPINSDSDSTRTGKEKQPSNEENHDLHSSNYEGETGLVLMIPEVQSVSNIPYYHPPVRALAFRYEAISSPPTSRTSLSVEDEDNLPEVQGTISIGYLPFPEGIPLLPSTHIPVGTGTKGSKKRSPLGSHVQSSISNPNETSTPAVNTKNAERHTELHNVHEEDEPIISPSKGGSAQLLAQAQAQAQAKVGAATTKPKQNSDLPQSPTSPTLNSDSTLTTTFSSTKPPPLSSVQAADSRALAQAQKQAEDRLYRTCLGLLERVYKHGYGKVVGYQKRREHDVIVPRDNFQDLYLVLKDRHRHLDSRAPKVGTGMISKLEDVKRHVWKGSLQSTSASHHPFRRPRSPTAITNPDDPGLPNGIDLSEWGKQDVAIAAFLMLLWKDMYPARQIPSELEEEDEVREWDTWGRPEGGFIDLGCGNGLLVHILISEGYTGKGYELRARRTWPLYPPKTQNSLVELPINPVEWFPQTMEEWDSGQWAGKDECVVKDGTFLIGNHSDELTPWLPLLSLLPSTPVPHLSLPCCFHTLDSSFDLLHFTPPSPVHPYTPEGGFENGLEAGTSRYKSYLIWLGWCGLMCGWLWEKEGLRVPSTKGWGIIARNRWTESDEEGDRTCRLWALDQVDAVRKRGAFKVREKEGKEH